MGHLLQPARANTVCAFLVFLHLLKGRTERVPQLLLAHRKHHPAHAHPATHMPVDGVWGLFGDGHNNLLWALSNVPGGRAEGNRIPSKIGKYCKKLLERQMPRLLVSPHWSGEEIVRS